MIYRVWLPGPQAPSGVVADPSPSEPVVAALAVMGVAPRDVRGGVVVAELTPDAVELLRSRAFEVALIPGVPKLPPSAVPEGFGGFGVPWPLHVVALRVPHRPGLLPMGNGLRERERIGERLVIVRGHPAAAHALEDHPAVLSVTRLQRGQVLQRGLEAQLDEMDLIVLVDDREDLEHVVGVASGAMTAAPEAVEDGRFPPRFIVRVRGRLPLARRLAALPGVRRVERVAPDVVEDGEASCRTAQHDGVVWAGGWRELLADVGLTGKGVRVGLWDGGLRRKSKHLKLVSVVGTTSTTDSDHATKVASVLVGRGVDATEGLGVAPGAGLCFHEAGFRDDVVVAVGKTMRAGGARIVNVSLGLQNVNEYALMEQVLDREVRKGGHELTFVFSSGNNGFHGNLSTLSKLPKNGVLVSASTMGGRPANDYADSDSVWSGSGAGPTEDKRRLPTVCAPGADVWVVTQSSGSASSVGMKLDGGTSYAAPVVSGLLALLAEQRANEQAKPLSPAAHRALLVAYARPMVGTWGEPHHATQEIERRLTPWHPASGWGAVDARALLRRPEDGIPTRQVYDQTSTFTEEGQQWSVRLRPADRTQSVRVVLAWTDAPGPTGLTGTLITAMVNKLTLNVVAGGAVHEDQRRQRFADGRPAPDNLLVVDLPASDGVFTVEVSAEALHEDAIGGGDGVRRQDFALVVTNAVSA